MPIIPGVNEREVKSNPANTPSFDIQTSGEAFSVGISKSLAGLGAGLDNVADVAAKLAAKGRKDKEDAEAKKAAEKAADEKNSLFQLVDADASDAQNGSNLFYAAAQQVHRGFLGLSGGAAVNELPAATQQLDQLKAQALAAAATPRAAQFLEPAITGWSNAVKDSLARHAAAQQPVYDDDLDESQVLQNRAAVSLVYNDDQNFFRNLHVAIEARQGQALRHVTAAGVSPGTVTRTLDAAKRNTTSDFIRARIEGALGQGDVATAQALQWRWGDDLLPADQAVVNRYLGASQFVAQMTDATSRIMMNRPLSDGRATHQEDAEI